MRLLRDARPQVEALENDLAQAQATGDYMKQQNNAYRSTMPDERARIKKMVDEGLVRGRAAWGRNAPEDVLRFYPGSYQRMREMMGSWGTA